MDYRSELNSIIEFARGHQVLKEFYGSVKGAAQMPIAEKKALTHEILQNIQRGKPAAQGGAEFLKGIRSRNRLGYHEQDFVKNGRRYTRIINPPHMVNATFS